MNLASLIRVETVESLGGKYERLAALRARDVSILKLRHDTRGSFLELGTPPLNLDERKELVDLQRSINEDHLTLNALENQARALE